MAEEKRRVKGELIKSSGLNLIDPAKLAFSRHRGQLCVTTEDRSHLKIGLRRAFPLSDPGHYYSVRDAKDEEIGMIVDPEKLTKENRAMVEDELRRVYFMPVIERIVKMTERFGTVDWEVETSRGAVTFTTRDLRDAALRLPKGRYILTDVDGNRFDVPDLAALDTASQTHLLQHL